MPLATSGQRAGEPISWASWAPSTLARLWSGLWEGGQAGAVGRGEQRASQVLTGLLQAAWPRPPPPRWPSHTPLTTMTLLQPGGWTGPASQWGGRAHLSGTRYPERGPWTGLARPHARLLPGGCRPETAPTEASHERSQGLSTRSRRPEVRWCATVVGCRLVTRPPSECWGRVPERGWLPWPGRGRGTCLFSFGAPPSPWTGQRRAGSLGVALLPLFIASDGVAGAPASVFGGSAGGAV